MVFLLYKIQPKSFMYLIFKLKPWRHFCSWQWPIFLFWLQWTKYFLDTEKLIKRESLERKRIYFLQHTFFFKSEQLFGHTGKKMTHSTKTDQHFPDTSCCFRFSFEWWKFAPKMAKPCSNKYWLNALQISPFFFQKSCGGDRAPFELIASLCKNSGLCTSFSHQEKKINRVFEKLFLKAATM